jgi:hypothetical protein
MAVAGYNESRSRASVNLNLGKIEEDKNEVEPLHRSVRLRGSPEKVCQIIRNEKVLDAITQKKETIENLNILRNLSP